jgi:mannosyltransferase OCH1-like enzyme
MLKDVDTSILAGIDCKSSTYIGMNRGIVIFLVSILLLAVAVYTNTSAVARQDKKVNGIPLTIYGYWHSHEYPPGMKEAIRLVKERNPEFQYAIVTESEAHEFIRAEYPEDVSRAFRSLKPSAYKSDLWRYCVLYKRGGVYMDTKFITEIPLLDIIRQDPKVYVKDIPKWCNGTSLANGFMISPPGNPVLKACIEEIIVNCKKKSYRNGFLDITGPCLLGRMARRYESGPFIYSNPYSLVFPNGVCEIHRSGTCVLREYKEYRDELKKYQKEGKYYKELYDAKDVFNEF